MAISTPNFELPIKQMTFNEKEGWWECPLLGRKDRPLFAWLEPASEEKRIYFNAFLRYNNELTCNLSSVISATLFLPIGSIATRKDFESNRLFFDLEEEFLEKQLETTSTLSVLVYAIANPDLPAWYIPYRPQPKKQKELTEGERIAREKRMQEAYAEWLRKRELQQKKIQEQKEQTEKEWEEWEKRQEEDNNQ